MIAVGTLQANDTLLCDTIHTDASGTLQAQAALVVGLAENTVTGSGTMESQPSAVAGATVIGSNGSGGLLSTPSTVQGNGT